MANTLCLKECHEMKLKECHEITTGTAIDSHKTDDSTMSLSKTAFIAASAMKKISSLASFQEVALKGTELKESKPLPEFHMERDVVIEYDGLKREKERKTTQIIYSVHSVLCEFEGVC